MIKTQQANELAASTKIFKYLLHFQSYRDVFFRIYDPLCLMKLLIISEDNGCFTQCLGDLSQPFNWVGP